jgi:hypothetical protein
MSNYHGKIMDREVISRGFTIVWTAAVVMTEGYCNNCLTVLAGATLNS